MSANWTGDEMEIAKMAKGEISEAMTNKTGSRCFFKLTLLSGRRVNDIILKVLLGASLIIREP